MLQQSYEICVFTCLQESCILETTSNPSKLLHSSPGSTLKIALSPYSVFTSFVRFWISTDYLPTQHELTDLAKGTYEYNFPCYVRTYLHVITVAYINFWLLSPNETAEVIPPQSHWPAASAITTSWVQSPDIQPKFSSRRSLLQPVATILTVNMSTPSAKKSNLLALSFLLVKMYKAPFPHSR